MGDEANLIKVVLADDQELVRSAFAMLVRSAPDMTVVGEAADGAEAVRLAQTCRADVVVMDIRMPGVDGIAATATIAADEGLAGVRVLILTTFESDENVVAALQVGASGFLVKDTKPGNLLAAIRTVASGDALLSPRCDAGVDRAGAAAAGPSGAGGPDVLDRAGEGGVDAHRSRTEQRGTR